MDTSLLEKIGLTKSEVAVYVALLELGSTSTGKIVDKAKVSSSKIYEILDKLIQKGLVSFIVQANTKIFEAAPPDRILDYIDEKEKELDTQKTQIKTLLPQLELQRKLSEAKSEATIYRGNKGVETAFYRALKGMTARDEMLVIGVPERSNELNRFFVKFAKHRTSKKIKMRALVNLSDKQDSAIESSRGPLSSFKNFPGTIPAATNIFNDAVIIFPEGDDPVLFYIESKEVADSFRTQFEKWWQEEIVVSKGFDGLKAHTDLVIADAKKNNEPYRVLGAAFGNANNKQYEDFFTALHHKRNLEGVYGRLLYDPQAQQVLRDNKAYKKEVSTAMTSYKLLPYKTQSPVEIITGATRTMLMIQDKEPIAISINNKNLTQAFNSNFESLWNQQIQSLYTKESIADAFYSILEDMQPGQESVVYGAQREPRFEDILKKHHKMRAEKGITTRMLLNSSSIGKIPDILDPKSNAQVRHHAPGFNPLFEVGVYGDAVLMVSWGKNPLGFLIKNKEIADAQKKYFELLWNQTTFATKGLDAVQALWEDMLNYDEADFLSARGYFVDARPEFVKKWVKKAEAKGFKQRNIVDPGTKGHPITKFSFAETRYTLPKEYAELSVTWIYGNKVVITNWVEGEPNLFIMEDKNIYNTYKKQFELLWNTDLTKK